MNYDFYNFFVDITIFITYNYGELRKRNHKYRRNRIC